MEKFKIFDVVALSADLPEENLLTGQVGTIVEIHKDGEAFEIEFVNSEGETYGLLVLYAEQLTLLRSKNRKIPIRDVLN